MVNEQGADRGYTLAEVMLTVAIVGILGAVGSQTYLQMDRYFILSRARVELQEEARAAMYVMTRALHQASMATIIIDRDAATQPFYSRVAFSKVQGTSMKFKQSGTSLIMVAGTDNTILSKNLRYLAFTFPRSDDLSIISVSFTLEKTIYQGQKKAVHMASEKVQVMNP